MKKTTLFITFLLFFPFHSFTQQTIYVLANATGSSTGTSWANAFTDLQAALATAVSGDEIWVAQGTYKPDTGTDRTATYLLKSGVKVYGGFAGNENALEQRNWDSYPTVLSGNIGSSTLRTDNSYYVVTGFSLDSTTTLDGFVISDGYNAGNIGSGIQLNCGSPLISNCLFTQNYARSGGAAYISASGIDGCTTPRLKNCRFERNSAAQYGGALFSACSTSETDTLLFDHCTFKHNRVPTGEAGGIYFESTTYSNIRLLGCEFEKDSSWLGGAISIRPSALTSFFFDSCVFYKNHSLSGAGINYWDSNNGPGHKINCFLRHCRFEGNIARTDVGGIYSFDASEEAVVHIDIDHCQFLNNKTISQASAHLVVGKNSQAILNVDHSMFIGNGRFALVCGLVYEGNKSDILISNSLFAHNDQGVASGSNAGENYANAVIRNCTFFDNGKYVISKNYYESHIPHYLFNYDTFYNKMLIENCILWEKGSNADDMILNIDPGQQPYYPTGWGYTIRNSSISLPQYQLGLIDAQGELDSIIYAQYPQFVDTLADDFRLLPCSPMVNKGRNEGVTGLFDLSGLPRIAGGTVDMGVYEQQDSCIVSTIPYIKEILPLSISPNPSPDGWCTLSGISSGLLNVYDLSGRVLHRQNIRQDASVLPLDLSRLSSGVYLITVDTEQGRYVGKWARE